MQALAIVHCAQVVTLAGPARPRTGAELRELGIIADGGMLVREGRIASVGSTAEIERLAGSEARFIDAGGRIVLPGFVDAHTHAVFAGNRAGEFEARIAGATYQEIAARGGGIRRTVRLTREATEEELLAQARRYREWFWRGGTTTLEAKSGYGLTLESELKLLRVIRRMGYVPTFLGAHEIPDEYRGRADDYVSLIVEEMLPLIAREKLAEYCDAFIEHGVFTPDQGRRVLGAARRLGLGVRVHADQFTAGEGSRVAAELGAATADHLECTGRAEMDVLRAAWVQPVLLPGAVYMLGHTGYPNAREMIAAGLAPVLATDFNPGSSPTASMPMMLSLAATQLRMTPAEAISAATINAAYSLRRGGEIGSLEAGKRADFVIHDCADYRELAYFFGREPADAVYVAGECVYRRGESPS